MSVCKVVYFKDGALADALQPKGNPLACFRGLVNQYLNDRVACYVAKTPDYAFELASWSNVMTFFKSHPAREQVTCLTARAVLRPKQNFIELQQQETPNG